MASFSALPYEIQENIFSRIRIRDLYEVSVVSEIWWWLTIMTYKGYLREEDQLIKSLLDFYSREKQLPTPLVWYDLVKYGNFYGVEFDNMPRPVVFTHFLQSRKQIRSLLLGTSFEANGSDSLETNLDNLLKYFPHLKKLSLQYVTIGGRSLKIPKGITQVCLTGIEVKGIAWSSLFEDPESIQYLELQIYGGLIYDHCLFKNLKSLSLHFETPLAGHQMKTILDLIRGQKFLKSVKLVGAKITKDWFNLFGKTIENISLEDIYIEKRLLTELGTDGCYERRVMSFVCSDFRTVKRFTLAYMRTDFDEGLEENDEHTDIDYRGAYTCRPQLMEEELFLELGSSLSRQVHTITASDTGLSLRYLQIMCTDLKAELLTNCVPAGVKKFKMQVEEEFESIFIGQLCEQPQNLEELQVVAYKSAFTEKSPKFSIVPESFTLLTQLKILDMAHVNREGLQSLLQQCVSLEKLTLKWPERGCFVDLSPACVSKTIREVNLYQCDARLEEILYCFPNLEVLRLSLHLSQPRSLPTSVAKLKLFSAMFKERTLISRYNARLALAMDTVDVPFKLFHSNLNMTSYKFILAQNDSFINEFYETEGYAYCRGFPTRFLESSCMKILGDVKHFSETFSDVRLFGAVGPKRLKLDGNISD